MTLHDGDSVWIPCDVTGGIFPDERNVTIEIPGSRWAGFVDVKLLRDAIETGRTAVRATIVEKSQTQVFAQLPGQVTRKQLIAFSAADSERLRLD
jgi:hypothetical protein